MAIHPSPRYAVLLLLAHLLAALAVYITPLPLPAKLAIFLSVLVSFVYHLARDVLLMLPDSWRRLTLKERMATIVARNGFVLAGQVAGGSVVTPYLVILRIKPEGRRRTIARVIFPDALEGDAFRELCVRLRFA